MYRDQAAIAAAIQKNEDIRKADQQIIDIIKPFIPNPDRATVDRIRRQGRGASAELKKIVVQRLKERPTMAGLPMTDDAIIGSINFGDLSNLDRLCAEQQDFSYNTGDILIQNAQAIVSPTAASRIEDQHTKYADNGDKIAFHQAHQDAARALTTMRNIMAKYKSFPINVHTSSYRDLFRIPDGGANEAIAINEYFYDTRDGSFFMPE